MLDVMRKNLKKLNWILWIIILSFVMTIFLVWGMNVGSSSRWRTSVAEVNGRPIGRQRFNNALRNLTERYRSMFGERFDEFAQNIDLRQQAIQTLVQEELVSQEAEKLGLVVSDRAVQSSIASISAFQQGGRFSAELYRKRLEALGQHPGEFEESIRAEIRDNRLREAVRSLAQAGEQELLDLYRLRNESVSAEAILVKEQDFEKDVTLTEEQKRAYYEEHKAEFQIPETVQAAYVLADLAKLQEQIQPTAEEIAANYEQNKESRYLQEEEVHARHILFRLGGGASEEEAMAVQARAQKAYEEIAGGRDFIEAANELTEDPSGKGTGGDLGWFGRGRMVPEFESQAFSLQPNEVSKPVKSAFGWHIIRLEARREAGYQPLAEVESQIRTQLQRERAGERARQAAEAARAELQAGKSPEEAAAAAGLEAAQTGFFGLTDPIAEDLRDPALNQAVFALQPGNVSEVLQSARGFFVFKLLERRPPHQGTLEEVDARLAEQLRKQKASELAKERVEQIRAELAAESLDAVAKKHGLEVHKAPELKRNGTIPSVGRVPPEAEEALFSAQPGTIFGPVSAPQGSLFVRLVERKPADPAGFEAARKDLEQEILSRKQTQLLQAWLEQLHEHAEILVGDPNQPGRPAMPEYFGY
jgi:peptidyl-prolyl cis-trans isomerase D